MLSSPAVKVPVVTFKALPLPLKVPVPVTFRGPLTAVVLLALPIVVPALPLALMLVVPVRVAPPVPCIKPLPEFTPTAVTAPALLTWN